MLTDSTDLELPGVLPVILRRAYASGYRTGWLFGPGWSSTLDQRLSINEAGIHFAGDDAQRLDYPLPAAGEEVLPVRGSRWPLVWDRELDEIRLTDPWTGQTRHFPTVRFGNEVGQIRDLTALSDRNGNRIDILRDEQGTPTGLGHPAYRVGIDTVATVAGPRISSLRLLTDREPASETVMKRFSYDDRGRLTGVINSSGQPFGYSGTRPTASRRGRIRPVTAMATTMTKPAGLSAARAGSWPVPLFMTRSTAPPSTRTRWATRPCSSTLDGRSRVTEYTWDSQDRLVRVVTSDNGTWQYTYDTLGRRTAKVQLAADGAELSRVTFCWDGPRLAEQSESGPDGTVRTLTWDYDPGTFRPATQRRREHLADADQSVVDEAFHAIVTDLVGAPTELVTPDGRIACAGGHGARGLARGRPTSDRSAHGGGRVLVRG